MPLAIGLSIALIALGYGLMVQGQMVAGLVGHKKHEIASNLAVMDSEARLGLALQGNQSALAGPFPAAKPLTGPYRFSPPGSQLKTTVTAKDRRPAGGYATFKALFTSKGALGLPNLSDSNGPGTLLASHAGLAKTPYLSVVNSGNPYAAYAPLGAVRLDSLDTFTNPTFAQSDKLTQTGLIPEVRAKSAVKIKQTTLAGRVYSENGPISVTGNALAFRGPLPADTYSGAVDAQVRAAMDKLARDCVEKGHYLGGKFLATDNLTALAHPIAEGSKLLTVQQALQFPFVAVPVLQEDILITILIIHHPWPADFTGQATSRGQVEALASLGGQVRDLTTQISSLRKDLDKYKEQVQTLEKQSKSSDSSAATQAELKVQLDQARNAASQAETRLQEMQAQQDQLGAQARQLKAGFDMSADQLFSSKIGRIPTNAYEDLYQPMGLGWAYAILGQQAVKVVQDTIDGLHNGQPTAGLNTIAPSVRLVHLGECDPEWVFLENGLISKTVWTVPPARTLKLSGSQGQAGTRITVQGDIWLQRGSTMVINGDLTVEAPTGWSELFGVEAKPGPVDATNPLFPCGRIFLEEGSKLIVLGNLSVSGGTSGAGSIIACSAPNQSNPINTAVLCSGNLHLAHGVASGVSFRSLMGSMAQGSGAYRLAGEVLGPLEDHLAPNLARCIGPWSWRDPQYFATFASTFVMFNFLSPVGVAGAPVPIPLPAKNCENTVFKYLSMAYSFELNARLGDNLYTMSWWWPFGRGVTPVMAKVPLEVVQQAISDLPVMSLGSDAIENTVKNLIVNVAPDFLLAVVNKVVVKVMTNMITQMLPFNFCTCADAEVIELEGVSGLLQVKRLIKETFRDELKQRLQTAARALAQSGRDAIEAQIAKQTGQEFVAKEVAGCLLYAGGQISVGTPGDPSQSLLASGFFLANTSLQISSQKTIGCLVCRSGDIDVSGSLLHYPWFSQASLFNPIKLNGQPFDLRQFEIVDPGSDSTVDIGLPFARVTAEGWQR